MTPTKIITETQPTNKISPRIDLSDFTLLETTPTNQDKKTTPNNAAEVACATLEHQQLTMEPIIAALTRKYYDEYERTSHFADSFWK